MAEKTKKLVGKAGAAKPVTGIARKPTRKPAAKTQPNQLPKKPAAKPGKVRATISFREGEYGKSARVEFPHPYYVHRILEVTEPEKQKKYRFRYFNNILVAGLHSEGLSEFLHDGAKKAGFELEIVKN